MRSLENDTYGSIQLLTGVKSICISINQTSRSFTFLELNNTKDIDSSFKLTKRTESGAVSTIIATQNYVDNKITGAINASY